MKAATILFADAMLLWLWTSNVVAEPGSYTTAAAATVGPSGGVLHQQPGSTSVTRMHIFIYETEELSTVDGSSSPAALLLDQANALVGVRAVVFGGGSQFEGYASKYDAVRPLLIDTTMVASDDLVVITDGRDVLINNRAGSSLSEQPVWDFISAYDLLTHDYSDAAVAISAEAQCCVSALTHTAPGGYFNQDGSRKDRSCTSGERNCMWAGDDMAIPWETYMQSLALDRVGSNRYDDIYLNAGLMVGTAANLLQLLDDLQLDNTEDDQAVLTDFLHTFPDRIVLDYGQTLFGNNRGGLVSDGGATMDDETCMFYTAEDRDAELANQHRLVHAKTGTMPLFVHSPGGFMQCHDDLAMKLGLPTLSAEAVQRRRLGQSKKCKNYKYCDQRGDDKDSSEDKKKDKKKEKKEKKDKKKDSGLSGGDRDYGYGIGGTDPGLEGWVH